MENAKIRIVDIAKMANVSTGTVDRVIHNRGKVSDENLIKVKEVLSKVDYKPNLMARSLASKRNYVVYAIIPSFMDGEYWADVDAGINRAIGEVGRYNVTVKKIYFDQYNESSFDSIINKLQTTHFDAVMIATLFSNRVIALSKSLDKLEIPYVYLDSNISDQKQLAYFGASSQDTGHVAASLLFSKIGADSDIVIGRIVRENSEISNQWNNRDIGFRRHLDEVGFKGKLHYATLRLNDNNYNFTILDDLFSQHTNILGAITFHSTCYVLGEYFKARGIRNITLIGYDIIKNNADMLRDGTVAALIAQRPELQGYNGIMSIYGYLVLGRKVNAINYMPIDILVKENLLFYNNRD